MVSLIKRQSLGRFLRPLATLLTIASLLFVGVWLYTRRQELAQIEWARQWPILLLLIGMYGLSFVLEFMVWHSYMRLVTPIPWLKDLRLYAYSNLSRRLPSGLGYLFVRVVRYRAEGIGSAMVLYFSAQEFLLMVITGIALSISVFLNSVDLSFFLLLALTVALIAFIVRPQLMLSLLQAVSRGKISLMTHARASRRLVTAWIVIYIVAWINGGVMLYLMISSLSGTSAVELRQATGYWASSATFGLIAGLMPAGQLARDASLSVMLGSYMPLSVSILIALAFRFVITVGDVVWSLLLFGFSSFTRKKY